MTQRTTPTARAHYGFDAPGMTVVQSKPAFGVALSLMWIVVADKPLTSTEGIA
ncbi:hypothetical protein U1701_04375 [Sphingomonas sp. PB2P19]|uniref:hypothetical protein n=1 Tax=Sphingomonas rhamnosi TaxID=3096156 RepID=UPI002FCB289C